MEFVILGFIVLFGWLGWLILSPNESELPNDKSFYRVAELNSAYDPYFGEGKGWIYCSNQIQGFNIAQKWAKQYEKKRGFKTRIDKA